METFDSLWKYCTTNNRIILKDWNKLFGMLKNKKQNPNGSWTPALPLILAAWHNTTPIEKQLRFKEHIQWAADNNQIDEIGEYLRGLKEEDWFHNGEL
jgi:hypothetical protein